jgi:hypothetical protein
LALCCSSNHQLLLLLLLTPPALTPPGQFSARITLIRILFAALQVVLAGSSLEWALTGRTGYDVPKALLLNNLRRLESFMMRMVPEVGPKCFFEAAGGACSCSFHSCCASNSTTTAAAAAVQPHISHVQCCSSAWQQQTAKQRQLWFRMHPQHLR